MTAAWRDLARAIFREKAKRHCLDNVCCNKLKRNWNLVVSGRSQSMQIENDKNDSSKQPASHHLTLILADFTGKDYEVGPGGNRVRLLT